MKKVIKLRRIRMRRAYRKGGVMAVAELGRKRRNQGKSMFQSMSENAVTGSPIMRAIMGG